MPLVYLQVKIVMFMIVRFRRFLLILAIKSNKENETSRAI